MSTNSFFLFGSLAEGMCLFQKIKTFVSSCEKATFTGSAYRLKLGFPVLSKEGSDQIEGHLVECPGSDMIVNLFDELMGYNPQNLEKSLNLRETIQIDTEMGKKEAFAYFLNPNKFSAQVKYIENGDWKKSVTEAPPIPMRLSEKQKTYIQKLGQCSGRDIVPIDLSLYRELMNLELVIDKGRRIALTKLGQEVYRHI
jgi:gamma-glutamylcyclotransferase (GGCT)/AIG2-like uncharacterized protein YtfP